jgi:hypothetical protein
MISDESSKRIARVSGGRSRVRAARGIGDVFAAGFDTESPSECGLDQAA